jgi:hypothetical protein
MKLTIDRACVFVTMDDWSKREAVDPPKKLLESTDVVTYLSHVPGGMVKVRLANGEEGIINPLAAKELRD